MSDNERWAVFAINQSEKTGDDGKKKSFWFRLGRAFKNRDGSFTLKLDALPLPGSDLQIRVDDREERKPSSPPPF